ncbi:hypothetical protein BVC80_9059g67 [Macleaya cordata]|uniref:Uncharacterized protein n=1 Tax=Macleaya cordata TaxID=56857 RepID=A0A200RAN9_MACCD|nr:hypothetical protein BVC80_9059g67 [Macleaya cordata]
MDGKNGVVPQIVVPTVNVEQSPTGTSPRVQSPSARKLQRQSSSAKSNCLCSPTTHVGSFRCRLHRNPDLSRSGNSIGSKLAELDADNKSAPISDSLHAQ